MHWCYYVAIHIFWLLSVDVGAVYPTPCFAKLMSLVTDDKAGYCTVDL